ncbi:hypothetical protein TD95_001356 [Thielaviopsis punctulata]|uniref:PNK FHA domain-containing protein n=1 Tax=Thielaviopsis punctulata TaxID=72032 RepID=A0A0F4ZHV3_9PEZI|nr:hypothetical protein TD95_001356 [Thielaviopsis punctulata]
MSSKRGTSAPSSPPPKKKVSGTTKASVANFFKPASQKMAEAVNKAKWSEQAPHEGAKTSMLAAKYTPEGSKGWVKATEKVKVAAFDLIQDSTLIDVASGKKFAKGADDWRWWNECVPEKLRALHSEGYLIAIFSNQGGLTLHPDPKAKITSRTDRVREYKAKCNQVLRALDLPVSLFAATSKDVFRKPRTGMWSALLTSHALDASEVDLSSSFFVGDAAGRPARGTRAKDFSCSDRNMAANLGLAFYTPEEYFLGAQPEAFVRDFDPAVVQRAVDDTVVWQKKSDRELVIFCGPPGAGKSSFWWRHFEPLGYTRINQDRLGSRDKCIAAAKRAIEDGASIVIDNTNADTRIRGIWIQMARENNMGVRCVHFKTPLKMCVHNDHYRANSKGVSVFPYFAMTIVVDSNKTQSPANPEDREGLPGIAFGSFQTRYIAPSLEEGLDEIFETEFRFSGTDEEFAAWAKYWS